MIGLTKDIMDNVNRADTLEGKIRALLDAKYPDVVYNQLPQETSTVEDIALIQAFHGNNPARIRATVTAIEFNLRMTRRPSTWIFVECQKSIEDCAFRWLKNLGIEHMFVPMTPESEGLMLKMSLWNIGAAACRESRLCFLDSDVVMCDSDWIERAAKRFNDGYDVLALSEWAYYQYDEKCRLMPTIGKIWTENRILNRHVGFSFGETREMFVRMGGFFPAVHHYDDIGNYYRLFGDKLDMNVFRQHMGRICPEKGHEHGYNIRFTYVPTIACHIWHGSTSANKSEFALTALLNESGISSVRDVVEIGSDPAILPTWLGNGRARCMKQTIQDYFKFLKTKKEGDQFDIVDHYRSEMQKTLGVPGEGHPLFVCTVVKDGFGRDIEAFRRFRSGIEGKFSATGNSSIPVVLFFTDVQNHNFSKEEFNIVPLKDYEDGKDFEQCMRDDLKWPDGVVVYYVPFNARIETVNAKIWVPDEKIENANGSVLFCPQGL